MNLTEFSSPLYLGLIYLLVFPIGYLLLDLKIFKKFHTLPFSIRFPIYLAFGLLSSTVFYYIMGIVIIDGLIPIIIFSLSLLILLVKKKDDLKQFRPFQLKYLFGKYLKSFFPIILFLFCFVYFSYVVGSLKWPTPSDALNHGKFTAQIISDKVLVIHLDFMLQPLIYLFC